MAKKNKKAAKKTEKKQNKSAKANEAATESENTAMEQMDDSEMTSYDLVPYESYPYPTTHPTHLNTIAKLFGLDTPEMENARVLELGCAGGGNLMSLAHDYPKAEFFGIDLSKEQIDRGNEHVKSLGLKNLTLEHMNIADMNDSHGKFDYIICHGVFSWVPDEIAHNILEICKTQLTENGLAVISYNCLPGWSAVRSVRDMMLYHTARFTDPDEKVRQARLLLEFLTENVTKDSPYKSILEHEKGILGRTNRDYILHEYLEDVNTQYYFHDFMAMADEHDLQYVGDSNISSMYAGNMPKGAAEKLRAVNDIIQQEQYMDYIRNRRFRYTILTHKARDIKRKIDAAVVYDLYVASEFMPSATVSNDNQRVEFRRAPKQAPITISDPGTKAVFARMSEQRAEPVELGKIVKNVAKSYDLDENTLKLSIQTNIIKLVLNGLLQLSTEPVRWVNRVSKQPKTYALAQYQGGLPNQSWVTNARRHRIKINRMTGQILSYADGTRTVPQIVEEVQKFMTDNDLKVMNDGKEITDKKAIEQSLNNLVSNTLKDAASKALLIE